MIDSVVITGQNYCPQVFLEECKYGLKEKKIPKYIIDDIEISDSDRENSDEQNSDEKNSDEDNSNEENSDEEK